MSTFTKPVFYGKAAGICFIASVLIFLVSSCVTQHNLEYIQDKNKTVKTFNESPIEDYKLKSNDELFIQINSLDEASANIFSSTSSQQNYNVGSMDPYGASLMSYAVDKDGYIHLPVIGSLSVRDKTLAQVVEMLKMSLSNILSQPIISVKLVNRYISVLGEVQNPGHFVYAQDKLTMYDAISLAGDITVFGNREEVILIRNENGKNIRINVNLNRSEILSSEYYNLRPNDIVYVKPLRKRFWGMDQFPYAVILTTITTALLIYTVIK
jgi:polysaccharide biosynthesis/export protein